MEHLNDEEISYVSERLFLKEPLEISENQLNHLESCQVCKEGVVRTLRTLEAGILDIELPRVPEAKSKVRKLNYPILFKVAAILLPLVILVFLLNYYFKDKEDNRILSDSQQVKSERELNKRTVDDVPILQEKKMNPDEISDQSKKTQVLAANFVKNPQLEELVNNSLRSDFINHIKPENGTSFRSGTRIDITWEQESNLSLQIIILDNRSNKICQGTAEKGLYTIDEGLVPGRYYFKIQTSKELLFMGYFLILQD